MDLAQSLKQVFFSRVTSLDFVILVWVLEEQNWIHTVHETNKKILSTLNPRCDPISKDTRVR